MIDRMTCVGAEDGIAFDFARARPGNTFDGHRLLAWAAHAGRAEALHERLFRGYFCDGEAVADRETLVRLATDVGLDGEAARAVLFGEAFADAVRADERTAAQLGIRGVPFFVVGGRYALSGAQPAAELRAAMARAWDEAAGAGAGGESGGEACGVDGCE
jgi:predicted DsbA family dithiol-disulfide isomerase